MVKCFAQCAPGEIVTAVGLELRDLFPRYHTAPSDPRHSQRSGHWHAIRECVQTLHHELLVCAIAAEDMAAGRAISPVDAARVGECAVCIRAAIEACM